MRERTTTNDALSAEMVARPEIGGLSRRTVIAAGAWSVPVLVAATATPAVAASRGILVAFAADLLELYFSDRLAAVILITNTGGSPFTGDFTIALTGFRPADGDPGVDFVTTFPSELNAVGARNQPAEEISNDLFASAFTDGGNTLTLTASDLTVPTAGLFLAVYIERPAFNPRIRNYLIAGVVYIDGVAQAPDSLTINTIDDTPPA